MIRTAATRMGRMNSHLVRIWQPQPWSGSVASRRLSWAVGGGILVSGGMVVKRGSEDDPWLSSRIHWQSMDWTNVLCNATAARTSYCHGPTNVSSETDAWNPNTYMTTVMKPSLEAASRALRLVQTVALMIVDYEVGKRQDHVLVRTVQSSGEQEREAAIRKKQLEDRVQKHQEELKEAQNRYTSPPPKTIQGQQMEEYLQQRKQSVIDAAKKLSQAEQDLLEATGYNSRKSEVHHRAATRLLNLCRLNGGVYIKIGQHLANMDFLIPAEYITVLSSLFDDAPTTSYKDVREVIREDLGRYPEEIFDSMEQKPIASASLAQVHIAHLGQRKLAVKVQHRGLRETSRGDIYALVAAVRFVEWFKPDFSWGWMVDEIAPQLPKELDFANEGRNAEKTQGHFERLGIDCVIPAIHWSKTSRRVLCMDFEEGFRSTNVAAIQEAGLDQREVAKAVASIFHAQVFYTGFVHCDPHPANVLVRPRKRGSKVEPQVVLIDHGLYKQIDDEFRITYAKLWKALMLANVKGIREACADLGIHKMYTLLAAMLTARPFDEIMERSKAQNSANSWWDRMTAVFPRSGAFSSSSLDTRADKAVIRGYAQRFLGHILQMLNEVPRQMLLLFKMNDCLRHIDFALGGSSLNTTVVAGRFATDAIYREERNGALVKTTLWQRFCQWWSYTWTMTRIRIYEVGVWWMEREGARLN